MYLYRQILRQVQFILVATGQDAWTDGRRFKVNTETPCSAHVALLKSPFLEKLTNTGDRHRQSYSIYIPRKLFYIPEHLLWCRYEGRRAILFNNYFPIITMIVIYACMLCTLLVLSIVVDHHFRSLRVPFSFLTIYWWFTSVASHFCLLRSMSRHTFYPTVRFHSHLQSCPVYFGRGILSSCP